MNELIQRIKSLEDRVDKLEQRKDPIENLFDDFFGGEMYTNDSYAGETDLDDTY